MGNCTGGRAPLLGVGHYFHLDVKLRQQQELQVHQKATLLSSVKALHDGLPHSAAVQHVLGGAPDVAAWTPV